MSRDRNDPDSGGGADDAARARPSDLGDGRLLPGSETDDSAAWLTEHPTANDDLADLPRLRELYQSVWPPEPEENAWMASLKGIRAAMPNMRAGRKGLSNWLRFVLGLSAAAAVLGALLLGRSWWTTGPVPQPPEEPYPVAEAEDVTIISMDPRDVAALVVGEPPVTGELVFARPDDVRVVRCERCPHSGKVPQLKQGEVPMFVTSVARADGSDDK
jgi:hypothetical protein